ncbi:hypothetical protein PY310_17105 [Pseudarthrobacter sp. H3Y2-7]|uniref:hypothetical protein n=1 Tax=Pseudarthrobacter naphthalenicus TaxID=3031328 RepID=UPI0023AE7CFE|nr:hypothetical protein [Pseudarthrobacter sp. H3Y2-7]MDE8670299.1 hypothetical protein [Pseudarthrobacter sp. H3Y2-7]
MIAKKLVLAGVIAAVALGGTAVVLDQASQPAKAPPAAVNGTGPVDSSVPQPSGAGTVAAPGSGTESPSAAAAPPDAGVTPSQGPSDPAGRRIQEVLPPASDAPTGLPMPSPPAALIRTPLPAPASAQGKIVDGFPANVVSFPDRTAVVSTSVSSEDRTLQASAVGIVDLTPLQTIGHFQQSLLALGFQSESVSSGDGRSVRLSRGTDTVTVAITTTGTGSTRFTLLATLHA